MNRESSIPNRVAIIVDGKVFQIKVSTTVFEEEQLFIDDVFPAINGLVVVTLSNMSLSMTVVVIRMLFLMVGPSKILLRLPSTIKGVALGKAFQQATWTLESIMRLQEVHVGLLDEVTGRTLGSRDCSGENKSFGLNMRASLDKFNWWVAQSKRKSKAKRIPMSTSYSKKRCVVLDSSGEREPMALSQEQRMGFSVGGTPLRKPTKP
ncbi:hypothetical protein V6N13_108240 [Hibiscus sabdariffa]|uniref:Uncharacterized protein n=1 Tax=Hibiscus sabdariffa TaxID=183260 RepID=A0ABR2SS88_9ROSI